MAQDWCFDSLISPECGQESARLTMSIAVRRVSSSRRPISCSRRIGAWIVAAMTAAQWERMGSATSISDHRSMRSAASRYRRKIASSPYVRSRS